MTCKLDMFTKVYLSLQDVIDDIQDKQLKDELQYQYDKEKQNHKEEINRLYDEICDLQEEIDDLYCRLNYDEDY